MSRRKSYPNPAMRWVNPVALAVLIFATQAGCRSDPAAGKHLSLKPVHSEGAISNATPVSESDVVRLQSAVNEVVTFRVVVRSLDRPTTRATLSVAPLISPESILDSASVTIYRMHRITLSEWPGWHIRSIPPDWRETEPFDVLVPWRAPRGGLPAVMLPRQEFRFWVDVAVPKGTAPGTYLGRIAVLDQGIELAGISVSLQVLPVVLPDGAPIPVIAELDHRALFRHHLTWRGVPYAPPSDDWRSDPLRDEIDELLHGTMRMLRAHGLTPVLADLTPPVRINARGTIQIDWTAYDAIVTPFVAGSAFDDRRPISVWPVPRALLDIQRRGKRVDGAEELTHGAIRECTRHFRDRGWLDRAYAEVPLPKDSREDDILITRRFAESADTPYGALPILSRLFPQDMTPYGWPGFPGMSPSLHVDIWSPPAQFFDPAAMRAERARGLRTWMSVDRPPFSGTVEAGAPAGCVLGLPWQAFRLGATAIVLPAVNPWPAESAVDPQSCIVKDARTLLYPGSVFGLNEPIPSVRLKLLRRAMYDAAYRKLVDDQGDTHIAAAVGESLVAYAGNEAYHAHFADGRPIGFALESSTYDRARAILADRIASSSAQAGSVESDMMWRRFMLDTRTIDVQQDGCRVRGASFSETSALAVDCWLTVTNRLRVPIEGVLRWESLPAGWEAADSTLPLPRIEPNASQRLLLTATASTFETNRGQLPLSVVLATDAGLVQRVPLRVSFVAAEQAGRSLVVDGDLSDWTPGRFNAAGDFQLIARGRSGDADAGVLHPSIPTVAFVARDREAIYIAVNAARHPGVLLPYESRNFVHYDDMIPVGEELVEVLLDPLNAGTRSPSDLYHIAVKPSGTYLSERGIRFDPPCGTRMAWSSDVQVATRILCERWIVEMRIPLSSFGEAVHDSTVWGFNVTRFDAEDQQFSTWSGAVGNAYDPLSLGNLYLPPSQE